VPGTGGGGWSDNRRVSDASQLSDLGLIGDCIGLTDATVGKTECGSVSGQIGDPKPLRSLWKITCSADQHSSGNPGSIHQ